MKVIIQVSETITDYRLISNLIQEIVTTNSIGISTVLSGGKYKVNPLIRRWAGENNKDLEVFIDSTDKNTGHWRNESMAEAGQILILIHDGISTGSMDMLRRARAHKLPVYKHVVDVPKHIKNTSERAYQDAVIWAQKMRDDKDALVLDTESCGGSKNDEIISLAVVRLHDGKTMFNSLIRPSADVKFNYYATLVHGITEEQLHGQPSIEDVWREVYDLVDKKPVLAYNHSADKRMINQTLDKYYLAKPEINWYCIMKAYKNFRQSKSATNLTAACREMNVKAGNHDALEDALAAARVVHRIAQEYKKK